MSQTWSCPSCQASLTGTAPEEPRTLACTLCQAELVTATTTTTSLLGWNYGFLLALLFNYAVSYLLPSTKPAEKEIPEPPARRSYGTLALIFLGIAWLALSLYQAWTFQSRAGWLNFATQSAFILLTGTLILFWPRKPITVEAAYHRMVTTGLVGVGLLLAGGIAVVLLAVVLLLYIFTAPLRGL